MRKLLTLSLLSILALQPFAASASAADGLSAPGPYIAPMDPVKKAKRTAAINQVLKWSTGNALRHTAKAAKKAGLNKQASHLETAAGK